MQLRNGFVLQHVDENPFSSPVFQPRFTLSLHYFRIPHSEIPHFTNNPVDQIKSMV